MDIKKVKELLFLLGADLCGIADLSYFEFGSMIWLGAVLCDAGLEPDKTLEHVCDNCNRCVDICPVNALQMPELDQQKCWNHAFGDDEEIQSWRIICHKCRDICPYNLGTKNSF